LHNLRHRELNEEIEERSTMKLNYMFVQLAELRPQS